MLFSTYGENAPSVGECSSHAGSYIASHYHINTLDCGIDIEPLSAWLHDALSKYRYE